jgi:hypothetical protein
MRKMHYDDPRVIKQNRLNIVMYKHGTENPGEYDMDISSIQECRYIFPYSLIKFLHAYKYLPILIEKFEELEFEKWYLFEIKFLDCYELNIEVLNVTDVSDSNNNFHRLH